MKFAHYDASGLITFYAPGLLPRAGLPEPFIEVSDEDWQRHVTGDVFWRVDDSGAAPKLIESAPDVQPVYSTREEARAAMVGWIDGFLTQISGQVPSFERASWPSKAEAARAFVSGSARPDQEALLNAEASTSNRTIAELAAVIIARADAYETVIGQATGLRVMLDDAIEAETDPFNFETILDGGKAQAIALAANLGITIN